MIQLTQKKQESTTLEGRVDQNNVRRGHWTRPTGAGKHHDRRTKRLRTRGAALRASVEG